jgi:beta-barrel assembly-enhancing protease
VKLSLAFVLSIAVASGVWADDQKNKKDDPSQIGNRDVGKGINIYSLEREMALGKQLAEEVTRQSKLQDDPLVSEYVNRICQNLARTSDAKVPITCQLIEGESPNAFALPGGYIFVFTGLIRIASEEDELAAAIAHEIAHVAARHMTKQATKSAVLNAASLPISILLGGGLGGYAARQGMGLAIPTAFLHFTRADETEADYLGLQYMYAAGYDPNGAISIFEKLESLERTKPGTISKIFSTHPMDADRINKTEKEIGRILPDKPQYVITTSDYSEMRERLIRLEGRRRGDPSNGRPTLRVAPGADPQGADPQGADDADKDGRPTIRRRDLIE